jgi:hypothetical protein
MPRRKRQKTRLSHESATAARGTSSRSIRSSRRRASCARWSSSTRGTLLFHRFAFSMAPSITRTLPTAARGGAAPISRPSPNVCELHHITRDLSGADGLARVPSHNPTRCGLLLTPTHQAGAPARGALSRRAPNALGGGAHDQAVPPAPRVFRPALDRRQRRLPVPYDRGPRVRNPLPPPFPYPLLSETDQNLIDFFRCIFWDRDSNPRSPVGTAFFETASLERSGPALP